MAHWYYYDSSNTKQGPVNDAVLKHLSSNGTITRDTIIENSFGKQGQASKIKGLFSETSSETPVPKPPVNPADGSSTGSSFNREVLADNSFVPPPLPNQDNPFVSPATLPQPPSFPEQDNPFTKPVPPTFDLGTTVPLQVVSPYQSYTVLLIFCAVIVICICVGAVMVLQKFGDSLDTDVVETDVRELIRDIIEERTVSFHLSQSTDGMAKLENDYDNLLEGEYSLLLRFNKSGVADIVFTNSNPEHLWNLNKFDAIRMSLIDNPSGKAGLMDVIVRMGDGPSYYQYRADEQSPWWPKRNWFVFEIPLEGNRGDYRRTSSGHPDMSRIEWIEVRFVTNGATTINMDKLIFVEK